MKKPKRCNGFTLIELLIGVAIISLIVAIAYPNIKKALQKTGRTERRGVERVDGRRVEHYDVSARFYKTGEATVETANGNVITYLLYTDRETGQQYLCGGVGYDGMTMVPILPKRDSR